MATAKIVPQKASTSPSLHSVKQGDFVWIDTQWYSTAKVERRLVEIVHVNARGRLFISAPELWDNWRYGFVPETGLAPNYSRHQMLWATPGEIEAEKSCIQAEEEAKVAEFAAAAVLHRKREAAPELFAALKCLLSWTDVEPRLRMHHEIDTRTTFEEAKELARAALALAEQGPDNV